MKILLLLLVSLGFASPASAAKFTREKLVSYFAGKDEDCSSGKLRLVKARLTRLVTVVDYFEGDREKYCTVVLDTSPNKKKPKEERLSASTEHCDKLGGLKKSAEISFEVHKDHVCNILP